MVQKFAVVAEIFLSRVRTLRPFECAMQKYLPPAKKRLNLQPSATPLCESCFLSATCVVPEGAPNRPSCSPSGPPVVQFS